MVRIRWWTLETTTGENLTHVSWGLRVPRDWCLTYELQIRTFQERVWLMQPVVGACSSRMTLFPRPDVDSWPERSR